MKIAMLSYNSILPEEGNGWVNGILFMIQSETGQAYGAAQNAPLYLAGAARAQGIQQVQGMVASHWDQLAEILPELDAVIIYVGDSGSEHTIKHAADHGLDPSKAIFVSCSCNRQGKAQLIREHGFEASPVIMCECGGRDTMYRMAKRFLETGRLD
jgi:hypothetical protein